MATSSPVIDQETRRRLELAMQVAKTAGRQILRSFQDERLAVEQKVDRSVVTEADRAAETLLRQTILHAFADDTVVGEEHGTSPGSSGWTWYLDPIDGTQAFVRGVPLFGTLIGIEYNGESRAGVICLPALGEMVYAARGHGCHWVRGMQPEGDSGFSAGEKQLAHVSKVAALPDALFLTSWMQSFFETGTIPKFLRLSEATGVTRGWGDCYGYTLVATGRAEIMVDPVLNVWDAGPMLVVLEEAGGCYTTFAGKPDIHGGTGVATNGLLHKAVLEILK